MTSNEAIISTLGKFGRGLCDDCLSRIAAVSSRQTVNQMCRHLHARALITRSKQKCFECSTDKLVNKISGDPDGPLKGESSVSAQDSLSRSWYWEGRVQDVLANFLAGSGWTISRVADTARKERGKDIEASGNEDSGNGGKTLWLTVKGYPDKSPNQQARHWFAEVVYDLVRYRTEHPTVVLGLGLPDHRTYRFLAHRIAWLKRELPFQFYWVGEDGRVIVE